MIIFITLASICTVVIVFYNLYSNLEREYFLKCSKEKFLIKEKENLESEVRRYKQYIEYVKRNPEKLFYS